jgi:enoyl-CoA hydratase/carnithine racemase
MEDRVRLTIADGIAEVRLNRAAKMNALDAAMFEAIAEAGARLKDDRTCAPWCSPAKAARTGSMQL